MRILRIAQNLYPEVPGGGSYHVHALSRDQGKLGHDVTVLTVDADGTLPECETRNHYDVVRRRPTASILGNDISAGVLRYMRERDDFDVVHAHSHLYFSTNVAAMYRRLRETPLAITNHGLYSQSAPEWLFKQYLRTIGRWTFNSADIVFCYTEADKRRVEAFDVSSDIVVVSNGVDTDRFTPEGPVNAASDHKGPVLLFVGRLVAGKRPRDAIEAIDKLSETVDAKLVVVGEGPLREELESMVRERELKDRVQFLGQVGYDQMPAIYRSGDVLLLPSRAEGLPRTVLEAMATGVPVVSSDLDQLAPIVERHGRTVAVGDVPGFVSAIRDVLREANKAESMLEEQFIWERTVIETTDELVSLAAQSR